MHHDLSVLRALARVSRKRLAPTLDALAVRAGGEPADVAVALERLERAGLVSRRSEADVRLTMIGLAVAASSAGAQTAKRTIDRRGAKRAA